jgi:hypothetical protein
VERRCQLNARGNHRPMPRACSGTPRSVPVFRSNSVLFRSMSAFSGSMRNG